MRSTIQRVVLNWMDGARWQDDTQAERVAEKIAEAPELYITPNPDSCGTYWEEASRIYQEIKDEYGLRTIDEGVKEATDYEDQQQQAAARQLRDAAGEIAQGGRTQLVRDLEEAYGPEFVAEALDGTVADPDTDLEPLEAETETEAAETETVATETVDAEPAGVETEPGTVEADPVPEAEPEPEPESEPPVAPVGLSEGPMDDGGAGDSDLQPWGLPATNGVQSGCEAGEAVADGGTDTDEVNLITNDPVESKQAEQGTIDPPSPSLEETTGPRRDEDPEHWPERGSEPEIDHYYKKLRLYVEMVADGFSDALMLEAPPGIGKSYQIMQVLENELVSSEYKKISGKASPLELFHTLYEVSDGKVLFIDDIDSLIEDKDAVALLKQATWTEGEDRRIEWRSTSSKLEAPKEFGFQGRIIMCFNEIPKTDDPNVKALKNRCVQYPIDFTHEERMDLCREVAKKPYEDLTWEERMETVDWLEERAGPGDEVTLRLLFHLFDMVRATDEWEMMAEEQLEFDPELQRIRELCQQDEHEVVKTVQEQWCEETGNSRKTFYRRWRQIKDGLEEDESLL